MVQATYAGELDYNNTKGILLQLAFTDDYGTNGVGDLLDLSPEGPNDPNGILDPKLAYNAILTQPPTNVGVFSQNLDGSQIQLTPNANPTLKNLGVRMFEPGGAEKTTNAAYTAPELAGSATLLVLIPALQ
jgi:hypothetical protein